MISYKTVGDLFQDSPEQWGLRGDPYLWDEMRKHLSEMPLPSSGKELRAIIFQSYRALTGKPLSSREYFFIDRFAHGGMSSGYICPAFWRNKALPFLMRRFVGYTPGNREPIRESYRPDRMTILFVGESPPDSEKFFYYGNGNIAFSTMRSFSKSFKVKCANVLSFLQFFKDCGCYLEDMCQEPVNYLSRADKDSMIREGVDGLRNKILLFSPRLIVAILSRIRPYVYEAAEKASFSLNAIHLLPFPGHGHQSQYEINLSEILNESIINGIFDEEKIPPRIQKQP